MEWPRRQYFIVLLIVTTTPEDAAMSDSNVDSESFLSPVELAVQIDSSLKSLLVLVGQSLRARSRLQSTLRLLQEKSASSTLQSKEELILIQQYHRGRDHSIPGLKALERECIKYDGLVKNLANWIGSAKDALELELIKVKAREETEKIEREQEALTTRQEEKEKEEKRQTEDKGVISQKKDSESIVIDDDEEEDDVPLASRATTTAEQPQSTNAIDLTDDSPTIAQGSLFPPLTSTMTDPTSLLASLSGMQNDNSTTMALDNFDFSQLGLQQMVPDFTNTTQTHEFPTDNNSLDLSMDFLDYNAMTGDGADTALGDSNNLFGNIDFSALLAGASSETKKE